MSRSSPVAITSNSRTNFALSDASSSWRAISAGSNNNLAINATGSLYGWGAGVGTGQLALTSYSAIAHGLSHSMALTPNGALYVWGLNSSGQLGNGTTINRSSPTKLGSDSWSVISAGWSTSGAIASNGALYMWGLGNSGQLGIDDLNATPVTYSSPVKVGTRSWSKLAVGNNHTAAITSNGELFVWGNNFAGQIGDGAILGPRNSGGWDSVILGGNREGIIAEKDAVSGANLFAWGTSVIGDGTTVSRISPVAISTNINDFVFVADGVSGSHYSAISSNGALYTWGINANGQLGDGTTINKSSPVKIGAESWSKVAVGGSHTIAIHSNGSLYLWGVNATGQLGDGTTVSKSSPIKLGSESWTEVAASNTNSFAIRSDGTLYSWGSNVNGCLGNFDDTFANRSSPVQISGSWSKITASNLHVLAINSTGSLFGWGRNESGQLGKTGETYNVLKTTSWTQVAIGKEGTTSSGPGMLAKNVTGVLYGWGLNSAGQLGDGTTINKSSPVQIGAQSWNFIAIGGGASGAIHGNGALFMWGGGTSGQLGDGTTLSKSSPVKIGNESWSMVSIYGATAAGIIANGALYVWGVNSSGQIGDGTTVSKSSPVKIGADSWTTVALGTNWCFGIASNGALYAWGGNASGTLGDGTTLNKSSPVKIGASSWVSVDCGETHVVAITSANVAFAWGGGALSQLGIGVAANRSSPVAVSGPLLNFIRPNKAYASGQHSAALDSQNGVAYVWGQGSVGQLGVQTGRGTAQKAIAAGTPVAVSNFGAPFIDCFSAGDPNFTSQAPALGALRKDGTYFIWGNNGASGMFGDGLTTLTTRTGPDFASTVLGSYDWIAGSMREGMGSCYGIRRNGELFSWGRNAFGALGIGVTTLRSSPVSVGTAGGIGYSSVFAMSGSAAAIDNNKGLWTWGGNGSGQLGDGSVVSRSTPAKVGSESWVMFSGHDYSMAIHANGALYTWGSGGSGVLGDNATVARSSPVQLGSESWQFVYAGGTAAYAIHANGALYAWGENRNGCLGDGTTINKSSPVKIGNSSWKFVRASSEGTAGSPASAAGITSDGRLFVWGYTTNSTSAGNPTDRVMHPYWRSSLSSPTQLGTRTDWQVVAFWGRSAGIDQRGMMGICNGELHSWGGNGAAFNLIGDGGAQARSSPVQIYGGDPDRITHLSLGGYNTAAVTANGLLYTWGVGVNGTLGHQLDVINRSSPTLLGTPATTPIILSPILITSHRIDSDSLSWWRIVKAGETHSAAITSSNTLFTWGINTTGQLGIGQTTPRTVPFETLADYSAGVYPPSFTMVKCTAGGTVALTPTGNSVYAWGISTSLGDGSAVNKSSPIFLGGATIRCSPIKIGVTNTWSEVSTSNNFTMAIRSDGALLGWGLNQAGYPHLGDQSATSKSSPVLVAGTPGTLSWVAVSAGHTHSLGITNTGSLYAWGNNAFGQCGVGTVIAGTTNILFSPNQVGSSSWSKVSAGASNSLAVDSLGRLFTWGLNNTGQLGIGLTTNRSSPVIVGANAITAIATGGGGTTGGAAYAIQNDRDLFVWGLGTTGQLGDSTIISKSSPVFLDYAMKASFEFVNTPRLIDGNTEWRDITTGVDYFGATAEANNILFTWGLNSLSANRLGSANAYVRTPTALPSNLTAAEISFGNLHSAFIQAL